MSAIAITSPGDAREAQAKPLAGLVFAYRFRQDGSSEQLNVEEPPAPDGGWLWLHFNLADMRACQYLATTPELPEPARALLVAADEHQQLQGGEACLYGVLADLVCGLSGATEEIGFLHFALTEKVFISSRRHQLNAIEATRKALRLGAKVQTPAVRIDCRADDRVARPFCRRACRSARPCRRKDPGR
jgi:zinc transporter